MPVAPFPYFPPGTFRPDPDWNAFIHTWYTKHLVAMEEPSLWELSRRANTQYYRFLWLRTFHQPVGIRVVFEPEGGAALILKITDGHGGYEPGKLVISQERPLTGDQVESIHSHLRLLSFWGLPTDDPAGRFGTDGARWILEGAWAGHYHLADRYSPDDELFRAVALYLVELAELTVRCVY